LRERSGDIPALVAHFMKLFRADVGRDITRIHPEALDALMAHGWPGNVRELQNVVHRAMLTCTSDRIDLKDLPPALQKPVLPPIPDSRPVDAEPPAQAPAGPTSARGRLPTLQLRELERMAIELALEQTKGHIASAAKLLGLGRATLYRRLIEAGIKVELADAPDAKE
jgi:DNA-binding NtrC family response regulator